MHDSLTFFCFPGYEKLMVGYTSKFLFSTLLAGGELEIQVFLTVKTKVLFLTLLAGGKLEIKVLLTVGC